MGVIKVVVLAQPPRVVIPPAPSFWRPPRAVILAPPPAPSFWRPPRAVILAPPQNRRHSGFCSPRAVILAQPESPYLLGELFSSAGCPRCLAFGHLGEPQNPQQIPLSSPSPLQFPPNPHHPNDIILFKSWHTSFSPSHIIKTVSKSKQTRPAAGSSLLTGYGRVQSLSFGGSRGMSFGGSRGLSFGGSRGMSFGGSRGMSFGGSRGMSFGGSRGIHPPE
jgi:hypothetical protein